MEDTYDLFRVTLNSAAVRAFWEGQISGMRLRSEAGEFSFLAVSNQEPVAEENQPDDFLAARPRTRGGVEFGIGGLRGDELAAALRLVCTPEKPYFLLGRQVDGWILASHYDRGGDPPRTQPAMRVWLAPPELPTLTTITSDTARAYAQIVRHASEVLQRWSARRRLGRAPIEVEEAQKTLDTFAALVQEVRQHLPTLKEMDVEAIRLARDKLSEALAIFDGKTDLCAVHDKLQHDNQ